MWRYVFCGILCHGGWYIVTIILQELSASIFRVSLDGLDHADGGSKLLWNISNCFLIDLASHRTQFESVSTPLQEPQISQISTSCISIYLLFLNLNQLSVSVQFLAESCAQYQILLQFQHNQNYFMTLFLFIL
jgi:hypothetical protein